MNPVSHFRPSPPYFFPALSIRAQGDQTIKNCAKLSILLYAFFCLCLLIGCDQIFKRQLIIDFQSNKLKSLTVSDPGEVEYLFSRLEGIANKCGLRCTSYHPVQKSYRCVLGTVKLAAYVTAEKAVTIELTQFGPWNETEEFVALEKELSAFVKEEFPNQNVKMKKIF